MAGFPATPAFVTDSSAREYDEAAAQTFLRGAAILLNGTQQATEAGADPALIAGFAGSAAGKAPLQQKQVGVAPVQRDTVHIAWEGQRFWMSAVTGQTLVYTDTNTNYGITKDADGIWKVDRTKTGASSRLYVHYVDLDRNLALVSVLAANRQIAP